MTPQQINTFWLDEVGEKHWYKGSSDLDQTIIDRFGAAWEQADSLANSWSGTAEGVLAALILTDQFPRNMFRENARSFATDKLARRIADAAIALALRETIRVHGEKGAEALLDSLRDRMLAGEFSPERILQ